MGIPLGEFDPDGGVLQPRPVPLEGTDPSSAVLCFFPEAIRSLHQQEVLIRVGRFSEQLGGNHIYASRDNSIIVFHPGFGGPMSAHCFEQVIATGVSNALSVGGAGSIDPSFAQDDILIVNRAVRDEGTSFHYLPPSRAIELDHVEADRVANGFRSLGITARTGTVWTTDADYREAPARVARRRAEGCVAVDMEAASLAAVAQFRNVRYAHALYGGDDVHSDTWRARGWTKSRRRAQLLETALVLARH